MLGGIQVGRFSRIAGQADYSERAAVTSVQRNLNELRAAKQITGGINNCGLLYCAFSQPLIQEGSRFPGQGGSALPLQTVNGFSRGNAAARVVKMDVVSDRTSLTPPVLCAVKRIWYRVHRRSRLHFGA